MSSDQRNQQKHLHPLPANPASAESSLYTPAQLDYATAQGVGVSTEEDQEMGGNLASSRIGGGLLAGVLGMCFLSVPAFAQEPQTAVWQDGLLAQRAFTPANPIDPVVAVLSLSLPGCGPLFHSAQPVAGEREQVLQFYERCGLPFELNTGPALSLPVDWHNFDGNFPTPGWKSVGRFKETT